jgi:hypothetical protein
MALVLPVLHRSSLAQSVTLVAGTTVEGAPLASVRSVGVGSANQCGGEHDT